MSKRAEVAAYNYAKENGTLGYDYNKIYDAAKNGYEQAEKDTIDKAKQWIIRQRGFSKMALQDFQKYMEEENE